MGTDTRHHVFDRQRPIRLADGTLAVQPLRLDRVEPRAACGQRARQDPHTAFPLGRSVVRLDPGTHLLADVPGGIVPDQTPHARALSGQSLADPFEKRRRHVRDRAPRDEAQQHLVLASLFEKHPVAGERLRLMVGFVAVSADETQRATLIGPTVHRRLGEAAPPDLIDVAEHPVASRLREADQPVTLFFLSMYCSSGLRIHCLARFQERPRAWIAWRMVSWPTWRSVRPCSKATSARSGRLHVERALPKARGLWWAISSRRSRVFSSKKR